MNIVKEIGTDTTKKLLTDFYNYIMDFCDGEFHEFSINDYINVSTESLVDKE